MHLLVDTHILIWHDDLILMTQDPNLKLYQEWTTLL
jgi:hypothetical protein